MPSPAEFEEMMSRMDLHEDYNTLSSDDASVEDSGNENLSSHSDESELGDRNAPRLDGLRRLPYFELHFPKAQISRDCAHCHKLEVNSKLGSQRFKTCAKCHMVTYCSVEVSSSLTLLCFLSGMPHVS
jgi:hypothetical protein